jgi:pyroglutamyl-peptidase
LGSSPPTVLVAAFEPFGGRARNRSLQVLRRLQKSPGLETAVLPVEFARLRRAVRALTSRRPAVLLLLGEAPRAKVSVEQVALNVADTDRPDNAGRLAHNRALVPRAPLALSAGWDARSLAARLRRSRVPAEVSFHAGTYACNAALYYALHDLAGTSTRVGFLHVPRSAGRAGLDQLERAVLLGLRALGFRRDSRA